MPVPKTLLLLAALLLAAAPAQAQQEALAIGSQLPTADRTMQAASGPATSFNQLMGSRGLAVIFWSNTCPWVTRSEERVLALAREYEQAGVGFVLVNPNDPVASTGDNMDAMRQRVRERSYPMPYLVDSGSEAARAFGATRTPQIFLFNSQGRLVYEGTVDDSPADAGQAQERYFNDALANLVADQPIVVEKTKAFGCTIKFQN